MNSQYKSALGLPQIFFALVATILVGSVALVGTVGPANATPLQFAAPVQA